jgi:hypothetical protein
MCGVTGYYRPSGGRAEELKAVVTSADIRKSIRGTLLAIDGYGVDLRSCQILV